MASSAFAFYMFGYQVHEKAVLLLLLPVTLLADAEPLLAAVMPPIATFSMWPLLSRDGLQLAYVATLIVFAALLPAPTSNREHSFSGVDAVRSGFAEAKVQPRPAIASTAQRTRGLPSLAKRVLLGSLLGAMLIHAAQLLVLPPVRYPFLWDALFTAYAFLHLALAFLYLTWRQLVAASHVNLG
jgi:alpha-1,3-glucosyltransferase